jgi:8-oxo-dGTP diphosphatase
VTKTIEVVAAVILRDDRVLAARRSEHMSLPNVWEFPGGKVEANESPSSALVRELREEIGCTVEVGSAIENTRHAYPFATISLTTFYASVVIGEPEPTEHAELRWCTPDELSALDWAPADLPAVENVVQQLNAKQR